MTNQPSSNAATLPPKPITILIADDHAIVRQGLRLVLESQPMLQVVGEARDGDSAITLAYHLRPDLILMDLLMPGTSGIEAVDAIHKLGIGAKILILTASIDDQHVKQAVQSGIDGYVLKASRPADLLGSIQRVMEGQVVFDPVVNQTLVRQMRDVDPLDMLTRRERDIFDAMALGMSSPEIAERVTISEGTVRTHIASILTKLGLRDRAQVMVYALKRGLTRLEDLP